MSFLSGITSYFGGQAIKDFPFTIGEESEEYKNTKDCNFWKLHEGKRTDSEEIVSIFVFNKKENSEVRTQAAMNCFKKMKQFITHPQMLKFMGGANTDTHIYIATEEVLPLGSYIDNVTPKAREFGEVFFVVGLQQLSTAVSFLNNDCQLVHGCIHPGSVFVNKAGSWKLGNFVLTHKFSEAGPEIKMNLNLLPERYHPKELVGGFDVNLTDGTVSSLDSWCLGCIIYEIHNGRLNSPKDIRKLGAIDQELVPVYRKLLMTKASARENSSIVMRCTYIAKNPAVRAIAFIDEIAMKSEEQKQKFYKSLNDIVEFIPESMAQYRVLPAMLHQLKFGSGSNHMLLATVLKLGSKLPEEDLDKMVIPAVVQMFSNNERSTRINLLKHVKQYIEYIPDDIVEKQIFPNVISGFADTSPALREVSIRSLISFAPKLSEATLNGKILQILGKCQTDAEPAIRTNTTVVIGEIAQYLSKEKQETILASAFTKPMKDGFYPARRACILSIEKCLEFFPIRKQLVANMLPVVGRACVDPYKQVRDPAMRCLKKIIKMIEKEAAGMPDEPPAQLSSEGNKEEKNDDAISNAMGSISTYAGWAVQSVSKAIKKDEIDPNDMESRMGRIDKPKGIATDNRSSSDSPRSPSTKRSISKKSMTADDDDFGDFDFDDEEEDFSSPKLTFKKKNSKSFKKKREQKRKSIKKKKKVDNSNPFENDYADFDDNMGLENDDPFSVFDQPAPKKKKKKENDDDPFSMFDSGVKAPSPRSSLSSRSSLRSNSSRSKKSDNDFDSLLDDMTTVKKPQKRKSGKRVPKPKKKVVKKKKPSSTASNGKTDLDDFLNSFS